jgi:hypothetical protein
MAQAASALAATRAVNHLRDRRRSGQRQRADVAAGDGIEARYGIDASRLFPISGVSETHLEASPCRAATLGETSRAGGAAKRGKRSRCHCSSGIDLHSSKCQVLVLNQKLETVVERRRRNELGEIVKLLEPHREELAGVAVESTRNWYWLVDGLMEAGHRCHLANTSYGPCVKSERLSNGRRKGAGDKRKAPGARDATSDSSP